MFRFLVLIAGIIAAANAYSTGAPPGVCDDLTPRHGFEPQTGPSPYKITINKSVIRPGDRVEVTLGSVENTPFKGFIIQARRILNGEEKIVGSFEVDAKDAGKAQTMNCTSGIENTATHKNPDDKSSVNLIWKASQDLQGDVVFKGTIVKTGDTFWVDLLSPPLTVGN